MAKFKAKVLGMKRTQRKFDNYVLRSDAARTAGVVKTALLIRKRAVQNTPRRVGNLANSAFMTIPKGPLGASGAFKGDVAAKMSADHATMIAKSTSQAKALSGRARTVAVVGFSAIYARRVHENPAAGAAGFGGEADQTDQNLNRLRAEDVHSAVGGWHFLLNAVLEVGPQLKGFIRQGMRARG